MPSANVVILPPLPTSREGMRQHLRRLFPWMMWDDPVTPYLPEQRKGTQCCPLCHGGGLVPRR